MKESGFGIASLVIGIISVLLMCFGLGFLGILGIIFAIIALANKKTKNGTAIAGLVTSIVGFLISFFLVVGILSTSYYLNNIIQTFKTEQTHNINSTVYKLGKSATLDDIRITALETKRSNGNDWGKPKSGNQFILVRFLVENNSENDITISSLANFTAYSDDTKIDISSEALLMSSSTDMKQIDGTLAKNKKVNGWVAFEIPKQTKKLEISFAPNILKSNNVMFSVLK